MQIHAENKKCDLKNLIKLLMLSYLGLSSYIFQFLLSMILEIIQVKKVEKVINR